MRFTAYATAIASLMLCQELPTTTAAPIAQAALAQYDSQAAFAEGPETDDFSQVEGQGVKDFIHKHMPHNPLTGKHNPHHQTFKANLQYIGRRTEDKDMIGDRLAEKINDLLQIINTQEFEWAGKKMNNYEGQPQPHCLD